MAQQAQPNWNEPKKKGRIQMLKEFVKPPDPTQRIADDFGILKEVAGLRFLQNIKDLEQRRKEIGQILFLDEGATTSRTMQKRIVEQTHRLFFLSGSPWYRGLNNRELTDKVMKYLRLYNEVAMLPAFTRDLYMCSMALLHFSFQAIDVTNTPAYVIQTTPLVMQGKGGEARFQTAGPGAKPAGSQQEDGNKVERGSQE